MSKPKLFVSFSGGRTSGFMSHWLKERFSGQYDMRFIFANTGQEREETLEFVERCDKAWNLGVVWAEAVINPEHGSGTRHQVVDFNSASRDGEPFEAMIQKYGIPNQSYPHCTRELKLAAMNSYLRSIGWTGHTTTIGIRADEIDRMHPQYKALRFWYPLTQAGITKQDVNNWWADQPFNLELKEHQGNCKWCWKKSLRKHLTLINEDPANYDFPRRMEAEHGLSGHNIDGNPRVFFRQNMSTNDLFELAKQPFQPFIESDDWKQEQLFEMDLPGGCSESCEAFGPELSLEDAA